MTDSGLFFNWNPSLEQSRPSQPARRMMVIPPLHHGHLPVPIQIMPSLQPQSQHTNQVHAPVQTMSAVGLEGQSDHLPGLEPIESRSSDDDKIGEDVVPDPPSPIIVEEAGSPLLVEMYEEEEEEIDGGDLVVEEDTDDSEEAEDETIDDFSPVVMPVLRRCLRMIGSLNFLHISSSMVTHCNTCLTCQNLSFFTECKVYYSTCSWRMESMNPSSTLGAFGPDIKRSLQIQLKIRSKYLSPFEGDRMIRFLPRSQCCILTYCSGERGKFDGDGQKRTCCTTHSHERYKR
ncbi:uncharacterized protein HD556DRAFT_1052794 [Suillus plorans]|uniref:Uncharacterized protein n=1 Tax=Suillus plorans TaxID=116603 RepID=A0A9P7ADZ7_9AGAM|nr:uncharacterized protein HD556DRAFT_1052794 [Suillus plorans]KAG1786467.1 hypothetical protein HD556DRAFT_1052794 [Suillus plorans]